MEEDVGMVEGLRCIVDALVFAQNGIIIVANDGDGELCNRTPKKDSTTNVTTRKVILGRGFCFVLLFVMCVSGRVLDDGRALYPCYFVTAAPGNIYLLRPPSGTNWVAFLFCQFNECVVYVRSVGFFSKEPHMVVVLKIWETGSP